jgi:sugar lactone lactonase YvrE
MKKPRRLLSIILSLLATCSSTHLKAQSYSWHNAAIGGGGFVTGTIFHPTEPGLVYARTDVGGIYRLDNTTQRWLPLNDDIGGLNNEFQHLGVLTIGLDPNDANRIYIATGQYGGTESWKLPSRIYRSTNRGNSWLPFTTPGFKMAGNGEGRGTGERMAVDPLNGANILVGTSNQGIWRSSDHGATWTRLPNFPSNLTDLNFLLYAPTSHSNPGPNRRIYAAANNLTGQSFWFSDNNGDSWSEVPNHPGKSIGGEMTPLQASFDSAGVLYSTWGDATGPGNYPSNYGVWKLSANTTTWTSILPPTGQGFFSGISADPRLAGHVVVSTLLRWWPGDEVYRSTDGGTTWSAALRNATKSLGNSPWATPTPHWMTDIDIDPHNSNRAIFNTGFGLFQTTNLTTTGSTRTWTFFNDGLEETVPLALHSPTAGPPLVSVIGDYTGFRHDNLNRSPLRGALNPGSGSTSVISGADLAPSKMIRQNSGTTLHSNDAAATWNTFPTTPAPIINGHHRVIFSSDGQRLLWCPPNSPAYFSEDNGASWTASANTQSLTNSNNTQSVTTLAGAAGTLGSTNSSGGNARFNSPSAIALDLSGIRYIADTGNHTIRRIIANGNVNTLAGGTGIPGSTDATTTNARFNSPAGITVDNSRNVYVADTGNHTIRKITSAGVVTTLAGSPGTPGSNDASGTNARFNTPTGLTVDTSGNVFVCDTGNHTIRKITPTGVVTTIAGLAETSGSTNATATAARFHSPTGITLDASGNLYVADSANHTIRKLNTTNEVTTFAGLTGTSGSTDASTTASARFNTPKAITIDASGTFHIADSGNHTVRKITPAGVVSTVAGSANTPGSANGAGTTARFNNPNSIVTTPDGLNIYLTDNNNHTIRRNTLYNTLTPIADRVDGTRFYLWDNTAKRLLTSTNGGTSFSTAASNMNTAFSQFRTVPGHNGHIWARAGDSGLSRSTNFGATFTKISSVVTAYQFDFGKPKPGSSHPSIFIWGKIGTTHGFFRSDDIGTSWVRINDNLHNFGYQNDIAGDPRVYGRVYLATSGRGVIYGDFSNPTSPASLPSQMIYTDSLSDSWTNTSPTSPTGTSLTSTNPTRRGTNAISIPSGTGKGVSLTCSSRSLEGYAALAFWITAATSPPPLQVGIARGGITLEATPITIPTTPGWQRVVIPFSDMGISNINDLTGLRIESRVVNNITPAAFSLDDVELVGNDEYNGITTATISLTQLSQTFSGTPRPITAITTPIGLPVLVTYNGSTTPPTAAGSYTVSAQIDDPAIIGSTTGTLVITKAPATISLGNLTPTADGTPKTPTATTNPPGLTVAFTFNQSASPPSIAGSYSIQATINDANYQGNTSTTMLIRQPPLTATDITGWNSNIPNKVSAPTSSSPLLNPNDTSDGYSTNTLQANFKPITLANINDKITLTGNLQMTLAATSGQGNWFRFGLYDNRGQAPEIITGWLGLTAMGMATPATVWDRTGTTGYFSSGTGANSRAVNTSPSPVGSTSPSGTPPLTFRIDITRTAGGILSTYLLQRTDSVPATTLLSYSYTDTTPNNNGVLSSDQTTPNGYIPTYTTAGFAFSRSYIGSTGAQAQFSNIQIAFTPGITAEPQTIAFPPIADRTITSPALALTATSSSGLPVTYQIVSGPATLAGNTLTPTGLGTITVRASQSGNLNFLPAPDVDQTFTITKAPATVTLGSLSPTYDGTPKSVTTTTNPPSLTTIITYDGSTTPPTNAGNYAVSVTILDDIYQGNTTATQQIAKAPQTIHFPTLPSRTFGDAPFDLTATAPLPVTFNVISGPATLSNNNRLTIDGAGTVVIRASQAGDANHLAAAPVEQSFSVAKANAIITLNGLDVPYDGLSKPVIITTEPANLLVNVTYDGSPTPPFAPGNYTVTAVIDDPNHTGNANATLTIGNRGFTTALTGWTCTSSTLSAAETSSPRWNPTNAASGLNGTAHAFFAPIQLTAVGDSLKLTGTVAILVNNNSRPTQNIGLWFRLGLFQNQTPVIPPTAPVINNWLGYCGMANSTPALYERTGTGNFGSSINGATARTPQVSQNGANSSQNSITLRFTETITRTPTGIDVSFDAVNTATSAKVMSFTLSDTTPNNNGLLTGTQNNPNTPIHNPTFSAAGFGFSGEYIGTSNASAQFTNVEVSYSSLSPGSAQTISFNPIADQTFGTNPISLDATSNSGLPITYTIESGPATLVDNTLTITGVGEVTVRASQNGNFDYIPATPITQSFTVNKAQASVQLTNLSHTYDGNAKSVTVTVNPPNLTVNILYNGEQTAPYQIGSHEVTAVITSDNYEGAASSTLIIEPIPQAITFAPLPNKTFGEAAFTLTATSTSGLPVSFSVISGPATLNENTLTLTGAGNVTVRATQSGDATHSPAPYVEQSFTVAKATATLTLGALTTTYDGNPKAVSTLTNPSDLMVTKTYNGNTSEPIEPGIYDVVATIIDNNYQGYTSATLTILAAHTPLEQWRFTHFATHANTGNAADLADPDSDSIANLMEFALGLNPTQTSTTPITLVAAENGMNYSVTRHKAAATELDFIVEYSDDLSPNSWTNSNVEIVSPTITDQSNDKLETIRYHIPTTSARRFVRLKVTPKTLTP